MYVLLAKDLCIAMVYGTCHVFFLICSGAQGEYTGLMCISAYLESIGQAHRNVSIILLNNVNTHTELILNSLAIEVLFHNDLFCLYLALLFYDV